MVKLRRGILPLEDLFLFVSLYKESKSQTNSVDMLHLHFRFVENLKYRELTSLLICLEIYANRNIYAVES